MSTSTKLKLIPVEDGFTCDAPSHVGDRFMPCDSFTLEHGYGSPKDGETQHFCSIPCLCDWVVTLHGCRKS